MARHNIPSLAQALSSEQREVVAARMAEWASVAQAHAEMVERAAAAAKDFQRTPHGTPAIPIRKRRAEELAEFRNVMVAVLLRPPPHEVAARIRAEWTRCWIGRRRTDVVKWMVEFRGAKRSAMGPPPTDEQCARICELLAPIDDTPMPLGWAPPELDPSIVAEAYDAVSGIVKELGRRKGADALLGALTNRDPRALADLAKSFGVTRIRNPRRLID